MTNPNTLNRRDALRLAFGALIACALPAESDASQTLLKDGSPAIKGDISNLKLENGKPLGHSLHGKNLLIYFGTSYRLPNCSADLAAIKEIVNEVNSKCGPKTLIPVFIYPEQKQGDKRPPDMLHTYIHGAGSPFVALSGPQDDVTALASSYKARYFLGPDGSPVNHTRFAYLMGSNGNNLGIARADDPWSIISDEISKKLKRDNHSLSCTP